VDLRTIKFRFYRGDAAPKEWFTYLVGIRSWPHTHVELEFSDGMSFSSSLRDKGVRLKRIDYLKHPERWTTVEWQAPAAWERVWRTRAEVLAAMKLKYDVRGILGFAITGHHNPVAFFCSEAVFGIVVAEVAVAAVNWKMHPEKLLEWVRVIRDVLRATKYELRIRPVKWPEPSMN